MCIMNYCKGSYCFEGSFVHFLENGITFCKENRRDLILMLYWIFAIATVNLNGIFGLCGSYLESVLGYLF